MQKQVMENEIPKQLLESEFRTRHISYCLRMLGLPYSEKTMERYRSLGMIKFKSEDSRNNKLYSVENIIESIDIISAYRGIFLPINWRTLVYNFLKKARS